MRNVILLSVLLFSVAPSAGCMQYIDTGSVGVRVYYYGSDKGVDPKPIAQGNTFYNPITQAIYEFPVYEQPEVWNGENALKFNDKTGAVMTADIAIQYHFDGDKVPILFTRLRKDASYIGHNYLRTQVREKISREAKKYSVTEIFGSEGTKMLDDAMQAVNEEFADVGIIIDMLSFNSEIKVDEKIKESINRVITAAQDAAAAENKVKQIKHEADQAIEKARGESESALVKAKKEAEANDVLTKSLSPELLKYKAMDKWDGVLPKTLTDGGNLSLFISDK